MQAYSHRQHSPIIPAILLLMLFIMMGSLFAMPRTVDPGPAVLPVMIVIVAAAAVAMLSRLTTNVDERGVRWSFGAGFPSGEIDAGNIDRAELTTTNFMEGWDLHWTIWHGWVWNVWGFQAVQIFRRDGSSVTIGTDDPQGFLAAINAAKV